MLDRAVAGGEVVDLGAEFIGPTQNRIRALVDELGIATFASSDEGQNVCIAGGRRTPYSDPARPAARRRTSRCSPTCCWRSRA